METVNDAIEVNVPLQAAYNQWTQFEQFPRFIWGLQEVRQLDDRHLYWRAEVSGRLIEWNSEITQQIPDQLIAWKSTNGPPSSGYVQFEPVSDQRTRLNVQVSYEADQVLRHVIDTEDAAAMRLHTELEHFKEFLESHGEATGAWRGSIPIEGG